MTIRRIRGDAASEFQAKMEHLLPPGGKVVSSVTWVLYQLDDGEPDQTILTNPSCCTPHVLINLSTANARIAQVIQGLIIQEASSDE